MTNDKKSSIEPDLKKLEDERKEALKKSEEIIDADYVNSVIKDFEEYVNTEVYSTDYSKKLGWYGRTKNRVKMFFRNRPWIGEIIKYSLYPASILIAYYFGVDRIFDNYFIGTKVHEEFARELTKSYNYVEFMDNRAVTIATNQFGISYPIKFTLLTPSFSNVTALIIGFLSSKYFIRKRQYGRAIFIPLLAGVGISVLPFFLIPHMPAWHSMLSSLNPEIYYSVPKLIRDLYFDLSNANPVVSSRGLLPAFLSLGSMLINAIYSFWKRKHDISERYND
jgi:hypothetical protein